MTEPHPPRQRGYHRDHHRPDYTGRITPSPEQPSRPPPRKPTRRQRAARWLDQHGPGAKRRARARSDAMWKRWGDADQERAERGR